MCEIVLFYPYAVARGQVGVFGLVVVLVFTLAVFESFIYLIGEGALDWGPESASSPVAFAAGASATTVTAGASGLPTGTAAPATAGASKASSERTAQTTVRRVGLEGRDPELVPTAPSDDEAATRTDEEEV